MRLILLKFVGLVSLMAIFYLSWVPNPQLGLLWFMPGWLAQWTDANENESLRTGVPFIVLGALVAVWLLDSGYAWYGWLVAWLGLVGVVLIAEVGQLFISGRYFDWLDILWGAVGAATGIGLVLSGQYLKTLLAGR